MISVSEAQDRLLSLVEPLDAETVPIGNAAGRVLASDVISKINQPPFAASAMDGYAIQKTDYTDGAVLSVIGEAAAGLPFDKAVGPGQAVRIFTGGTVPEGADFVLIQENVLAEGEAITVTEADQAQAYIRLQGQDFAVGSTVSAGTELNAAVISLIASMGVGAVAVRRKPEIAVISTGDELVPPGDVLKDGQIYASNSFGLKAALERLGADVRILPIARDTKGSLTGVFEMAMDADFVVTSGGASVGDHDLVMPVAQSMGLKAEFHKVRMRPGKPLMAGRFANGPAFVGLPGNPVSALVCAEVFIRPMIRKMTGLTKAIPDRVTAILDQDLAPNGGREHYMRGTMTFQEGRIIVRGFDRQDSALTSVLVQANVLIIREPNDPARPAGKTIEIIPL